MNRHGPADEPPDLANSELVLRLLKHKGRNEFMALLDGHPELLSESMEYTLGRWGERPNFGLPLRLLHELVRDARTDPDRAYRMYEKRRREADRAAHRLTREFEELDAAMNEGQLDRALRIIDVAMTHARTVGMSFNKGRLFDARGRAYFFRANGDRADNIERAIEAFEHAVAHVPADAPTIEAGMLMHLGAAYAERLRGDRRENLEDSIEALRGALAVLQTLEAAAPPDDLAIVRTNLANALLRREAGDNRTNASEAVELCRAALEHRSSDRDITDWAYTQVTLGAAMAQLAMLPSAPTTEFSLAREEFRPLLVHAERIPDPSHAGQAHRSRGRLYVDEARRRAEGSLEFGPAGEFTGFPGPLDDELLAHARAELERAVPLVRDAPDPTVYGRTLTDLAEVLSEQGDTDAAIEAALAALESLRPTAAPRECLEAAKWGGFLLANAGRWAEAASVYRDAVQAAELLFHSRLETGSRENEIRSIGEVPRWAADAIARTGELLEAALVLEAGRTRELRRRLGLESVGDDELDKLPADLRGAYEQAAAGLAAAPLGSGSVEVARRFQEVLAAVRSVEGFEAFGAGASEDDLAAAVEPGWPVVYVAPAPHGTMLLLLGQDGGGRLEPRVGFVDAVTSVDITHRVVRGDPQYWPERADGAWRRSYFAGISGMKVPGELDFPGALDDLLPWLGEAIARPIRELLEGEEATGVTLILCGAIAPVPLHAAVWDAGGQPRCLLDELDVRYAPSATVAAVTRDRAVQRPTTASVLVAVGDPTRNLRAAGAEVVEIARHFEAGRAITAVHENADSAFLQEHASNAQFLHLSCHARGGLLNRDLAAVHLADGWRSAFDLTAPRLMTRLVAVSACQSAHAEYRGLPEEAFSLGTAMIAAGSACAIASLWLVDDEATALLMVRLYDEMLRGRHRPPEALRRAQRWLRDLTCAERNAFLALHPALHTAFRERDEERSRDARRDLVGSCDASGDDRPYAHADYWAAFVAVGV